MHGRIAELTAFTRDDPFLVGYYTNNEPALTPIGHHSGWWQSYVKRGADSEAKLVYVDLLQQRYDNDFDAFKLIYQIDDLETYLDDCLFIDNDFVKRPLLEKEKQALSGRLASGVEAMQALASWTDLAEFTDEYYLEFIARTQEYAYQDVVLYIAAIAQRYAAICHEALQLYDPNHLNFGVKIVSAHRHVMLPLAVAKAMAPYADALAADSYLHVKHRDDPGTMIAVERFRTLHEQTGLPLIFAEMGGFMAQDHPRYGEGDGGYIAVPDQKTRAIRYHNYLSMIADHLPFAFGASYYSYADHADLNWGILDGVGLEPYPELAGAIQHWSSAIYTERRAPVPDNVHPRND